MESSNCILDLYTKKLICPVHCSVLYTTQSSVLLGCVRLFVTPWTIQSMEFSRPECWSGQPFPISEDLLNPGIESTSPTLWADSLPAEPQRKPKDTGVSSLSLLQQVFQESNPGLLHCRWVLYQLSFQGSLSSTLLDMLKGKLMGGSHILEKKKDLKAIIQSNLSQESRRQEQIKSKTEEKK